MTETNSYDASRGVAENFTSTAQDYDAVVLHNIEGARRLIASLPQRDYARVLDVGCGTGWASIAMARRFPTVRRVTGVDPAEGMLEVFRGKAAELPGVELDLRAEDVMAMTVRPGSFDAVISSMAMHWFPDKPGAASAIAQTAAPGGVIGILCSGAAGEGEFREVLRALDPPAPPQWDAAFDFAQRDVDDMEEYLVGAGVQPVDIWMERRVRHATPEAYLERMRVVASHISADGLTEDEAAVLLDAVAERLRAASGPRGFRYTFTKLFAVAVAPE